MIYGDLGLSQLKHVYPVTLVIAKKYFKFCKSVIPESIIYKGIINIPSTMLSQNKLHSPLLTPVLKLQNSLSLIPYYTNCTSSNLTVLC